MSSLQSAPSPLQFFLSSVTTVGMSDQVIFGLKSFAFLTLIVMKFRYSGEYKTFQYLISNHFSSSFSAFFLKIPLCLALCFVWSKAVVTFLTEMKSWLLVGFYSIYVQFSFMQPQNFVCITINVYLIIIYEYVFIHLKALIRHLFCARCCLTFSPPPHSPLDFDSLPSFFFVSSTSSVMS